MKKQHGVMAKLASVITFAQYAERQCQRTLYSVALEWLTHQKKSLREGSFAHYTELIENHIKPYFSEIALCAVTNEAIEDYTAFLSSRGRKDGTGGLASKTIAAIASIICATIAHAETKGFIKRGSIEIKSQKILSKEVQILEPSEQYSLERYLDANMSRKNFGILLCLYTGLRIGEICGLRIEDIDTKHGSVSVRRTIRRIKDVDPHSAHNTKIVIGSPKTEASIRIIPIPVFLSKCIISFCNAPRSSYLLTGDEHFIEPRNYYRYYHSVLAKAGIEKHTFHALRHTFATRCVELGFDAKTLSAILGHSSPKITYAVYVHSSMHLKRKRMNSLYFLAVIDDPWSEYAFQEHSHGASPWNRPHSNSLCGHSDGLYGQAV